MSTVAPVVKVNVDSGMLSLRVKDKVSGEGEVSPRLTNSEVEHFEAWYALGPLIQFLSKITSGSDVVLYAADDNTLVVEVESSNKNSRLYLSSRIESP